MVFDGALELCFQLIMEILLRMVYVGAVVDLPVPAALDGAVGRDRHAVGRLQFLDPLKQRPSLHAELEHQVILEALGIGLNAGQERQQRLHFRGEIQRVVHHSVIERLDAEVVPGAEQCLPLFVPQGEGEHAGKMLYAFLAPHLIGPEDHFRVAGGLIGAAQLLFEFDIVVDLPVEADPVAVVIGHGLLAGGDVDNAEPAVRHADVLSLVHPNAVAVRAAMGLQIVHNIQFVGKPGNPVAG